MTDQPDLSAMGNCVCFNLRRVSRLFTQFYVSQLSHHGLLPTQTPILTVLASRPDTNMSDLSNWLGMDRTTLVRNLQPLERDGLVKLTGKGRGNKVSLALTPKGKSALIRLLPEWQATQRKVLKTLGAERWSSILKDLEHAALALNE